MADLVNGRMVIHTPGKYQVNANVYLGGVVNNWVALIIKNGNVQVSAGTNATGLQSSSVSDLLDLVAGDFLELALYNPTGSATVAQGPSFNYMAIALITAGTGPPGPEGPPGSLGVEPAGTISLSSSVACPLNTPLLIPFDTTQWMHGGLTRAPNGGFIVPATGVYEVTSNILWNQDVAGGRCDYMIVNYTQQGLVSGDVSTAAGGGGILNKPASAYQSTNMTAIVQANANDVLGVVVMNRSADGIAIYSAGKWTMASCVRVSA